MKGGRGREGQTGRVGNTLIWQRSNTNEWVCISVGTVTKSRLVLQSDLIDE